jgi:sulfate permease, SulP family
MSGDSIQATLSHIRTAMDSYGKGTLRADIVAGLTVAMIAVPQAMAYAAIAGINPMYGLFGAILPAIVGSLFASSRHTIMGPTNATALITAGVLLEYATLPNYAEYVFVTALMAGFLVLLIGVLRLGGIIRFVSNAVLTGFLAGAGLLIIINQLSSLLGVQRPHGESPYRVLWHAISHIPQAHIPTVVTAIVSVGVLLGLRRLSRKLPSSLLAMVIAGGLVGLAGWGDQGVRLVRDLGAIQGSPLQWHLPTLAADELPQLMPGALAVALLMVVESLSIAKAIGLSSGQRIDASRQCVAVGLSGLTAGLTRGITSSSSIARTAVNYGAGARTRVSGIIAGVAVLAITLAFAGLIGYIPMAALAGIVVVWAATIVNKHHLAQTWSSGLASRTVLVTTFLATMILPLHLAIYLGTLLSVGIYLYESSQLHVSYLSVETAGDIVERNLDQLLEEHPVIAVVNIDGALFFGAVEALERRMDQILDAGVGVVILRLRRANLVASTAISALDNVVKRARELDILLLISGVSPLMQAKLQATGVERMLQDQCVFPATEVLFESTRQALAYAQRHPGIATRLSNITSD